MCFSRRLLEFIWDRSNAAEMAIRNSEKCKKASARKEAIFESLKTKLGLNVLTELEEACGDVMAVVKEAVYIQGLKDGANLGKLINSDEVKLIGGL